MTFSVLMSVYDKEWPERLDMALKSIWDNQVLKPSQIILVKDGPLTEELLLIIETWKRKLESLLCIVELKTNKGLATALNCGIEQSKYDLVARMDTDDLSRPNRFQKQVKFMEDNGDISICSAYIEERTEDMMMVVGTRRPPTNHSEIVRYAKIRSPINHPVAMFRKSHVEACGSYPNLYPEDYPLWCKMIYKGYKFANLPEVLLDMRTGPSMINRRGNKFLKGYISTYVMMERMKQINKIELARNILIQALIRLSPGTVRGVLYKYGR